LYAEAAALAGELRRLEGGLPAADADDLADLFRIEGFQPDPTESHDGATVFELYWALQLLGTVPSRHLSRFDAGGDQVLSHWREGDSEYLVCHDTDGTVELAGIRREFVDFVAAHHRDDTPLADAETRRGYLRQHYVELAPVSGIERGYDEKEPDLLVFELDAGADGWVLRRLFVGEVESSPNLVRVRSGLQELVEYTGFARVGADARLPDGDSDATPVAGEDFLDDRIEFGLFVGDDDRVECVGRCDGHLSVCVRPIVCGRLVVRSRRSGLGRLSAAQLDCRSSLQDLPESFHSRLSAEAVHDHHCDRQCRRSHDDWIDSCHECLCCGTSYGLLFGWVYTFDLRP
jgi:hypothetical protein